jgi:hypothetical protein
VEAMALTRLPTLETTAVFAFVSFNPLDPRYREGG